ALLLALSAFGVRGARAQIKPPAGRLFGFIQVDDHGANDGTMVVAHVNDSVCGQANYDATRGLFILDLDSSIDDCSQAGNTVWFSVDACTAYTTGTIPEFSGAERVDLVAPGSC
ncbi:MAG: hypothetical protein ACYDCQ_15990, partial [Dehalococcoidia bacterium]